jgi:hypothetical protein
MKSLFALFLGTLLLLGCTAVRAEGNCPQGYYPIGGGSPGAPQGCAPIPGYNQGQQQLPQRSQWSSQYGAIASYIPKGILGVATNRLSKQFAEQAALDDCRSKGGTDCKIETSYMNGCGAVVAGHPGYAVNTGPTEARAVQDAMSACTGSGFTNCHIIYTGCSLPKKIQP